MDFIAEKTEYIADRHDVLIDNIKADYGTDKLIEQIKKKNWTLYDVELNDTLVGAFVCRIETLINGENELVILHTVSKLKDKIPLFAILEPLIDKVAKNSGCKTIRVHSTQESVTRLIKKHTSNYILSETIFVKVL